MPLFLVARRFAPHPNCPRALETEVFARQRLATKIHIEFGAGDGDRMEYRLSVAERVAGTISSRRRPGRLGRLSRLADLRDVWASPAWAGDRASGSTWTVEIAPGSTAAPRPRSATACGSGWRPQASRPAPRRAPRVRAAVGPVRPARSGGWARMWSRSASPPSSESGWRPHRGLSGPRSPDRHRHGRSTVSPARVREPARRRSHHRTVPLPPGHLLPSADACSRSRRRDFPAVVLVGAAEDGFDWTTTDRRGLTPAPCEPPNFALPVKARPPDARPLPVVMAIVPR